MTSNPHSTMAVYSISKHYSMLFIMCAIMFHQGSPFPAIRRPKAGKRILTSVPQRQQLCPDGGTTNNLVGKCNTTGK